jgi:hypothetical protein
MVAKQPLPWIGEGLMAKPCASFSVICGWLLHLERASDEIGLIAYPR